MVPHCQPTTSIIVGMARLRRFALVGQPQHVIQRGNNRTAIFVTTDDYRFFGRCLQEACGTHGCQLHAYVLMTNHVHLLITPRNTMGIARTMQAVGRRYVGYFNAVRHRTGTLWEGRYRAAPVDTQRYLLACYRYIETNPVRAGLVGSPADYPWSSHRANAYGAADGLVTPHDVYWTLGADRDARQASYRALFYERLDDSLLHEIREATNKRWALGGDLFREQVAALAARRARPLPAGGARPGAGRPRRKINGV